MTLSAAQIDACQSDVNAFFEEVTKIIGGKIVYEEVTNGFVLTLWYKYLDDGRMHTLQNSGPRISRPISSEVELLNRFAMRLAEKYDLTATFFGFSKDAFKYSLQ